MSSLLLYILHSAMLFAGIRGRLGTARILSMKQSLRPEKETILSDDRNPSVFGAVTNQSSSPTANIANTLLPTVNQLKELLLRGENDHEVTPLYGSDKKEIITSGVSQGLFQGVLGHSQNDRTLPTQQGIGNGNGESHGLLTKRPAGKYVPEATSYTELTEDTERSLKNNRRILFRLRTNHALLFQVAVIVSKPKGPHKHSVTFVPLSADMTVLDAFRAAVRTYKKKNTSNVKDIPFNVVLDWSDKLQCYVTTSAVGLENKRRQAWYFTVRDYDHKIVYKNRCLPGDRVILRPRSSVQLKFEKMRRRSG